MNNMLTPQTPQKQHTDSTLQENDIPTCMVQDRTHGKVWHGNTDHDKDFH